MDDDSPYERMGGHAAVVALVDQFYTTMDTDPVAAEIRALHDDDLTFDKHKLTAFLSGWLGGPQLYWQEYGHPRLRKRHMHLPIDDNAARQWLHCMRTALERQVEDAALREALFARFTQVAYHMRNTR